MEPIDSLATNDWFKDYDSLFEMFDEEMRTGAVEAAAVDDAVAATSTWPASMPGTFSGGHNYESATYYATMAPPATPLSDYYYTAATFAATTPSAQTSATQNYYCRASDAYDLNNQYYNNQYQQHHVAAPAATVATSCAATPADSTRPAATVITATATPATTGTTTSTAPCKQPPGQSGLIQPPDDLSLFLGLDWLPCLQNELPETESVPNAVTVQPPCPQQPSHLAHQVALPAEDAATILVDPTVTAISSCSSSTASSPLSLQSHCEIGASNSATSSAYSSAATSPSTTSSSSPSCDNNGTLVCNTAPSVTRQSNHDCSATVAKRNAKKKCIRSRGTSLLAQPSPKSAATSTPVSSTLVVQSNSLANNQSHVISVATTASTTAAPTSQTTVTTLPVKVTTTHHVPRMLATTTTSSTTTRNVPILKLSATASLTSATKLLTYSNTCPGIITNKRNTLANAKKTPQIIKQVTPGVSTNELLLKTTQNHVSFFQTHQHLSRQEYTSRLCARVEHNYAMASS